MEIEKKPQRILLAIAIIFGCYIHAHIVKSKSKKDIGRYIMYDDYRFDTTNGEFFEPNGDRINEFVPLVKKEILN